MILPGHVAAAVLCHRHLKVALWPALVAGIFLAFLIDYLDDTVRDTRELEQLGLSVLGTIPPLKRKLWPFATSRKIP